MEDFELIVRNSSDFDYFRSSRWRCSTKKLFLKILQNAQENTCVSTLLTKRLQHKCFFTNFAKFLRTPFSWNNSWWLLLLLTTLFLNNLKCKIIKKSLTEGISSNNLWQDLDLVTLFFIFSCYFLIHWDIRTIRLESALLIVHNGNILSLSNAGAY